MGENKEKFINLLKSDEEVKKDMEKHRFGTLLYDNVWNRNSTLIGKNIDKNTMYLKLDNVKNLVEDEEGRFDIIGTLEERHLRMFGLNIDRNGYITYYRKQNGVEKLIFMIGTKAHYLKVDNKKSFDNQSEQFYSELVEFIEKKFNLKVI